MAFKEGLGRFFEGATGAGSDILQMMLMEKLGIFGNQAVPQGDTLPPLPTKRQRPTMGPGLYGMTPSPTPSRTGFGGVRRKRLRPDDPGQFGAGRAYPYL
jgi:hypothetical protein